MMITIRASSIPLGPKEKILSELFKKIIIINYHLIVFGTFLYNFGAICLKKGGLKTFIILWLRWGP